MKVKRLLMMAAVAVCSCSMWAEESIIYQIYPLGFCGAPLTNPLDPGHAAEAGYESESGQEKTSAGGQNMHRIRKVMDWIPHLKELGIMSISAGRA